MGTDWPQGPPAEGRQNLAFKVLVWAGARKGHTLLRPDAEMREPAGGQAGGGHWQGSVWEEGHWREGGKDEGPGGRKGKAWICIYFGVFGGWWAGSPDPTWAASSLRIIKA